MRIELVSSISLFILSLNRANTTFKGNAQFVQKVTFKNFDGFQRKPLWKLEMLQKLLILKVFFTEVIKTHNYFLFCDSAF